MTLRQDVSDAAYDRATSEPKNDATPPHLHAAQPVDAIPHTHSPIDVTLGSLPAAWAIVWLASSADDERLLLCRYSRGRHSSIELPYNRAMLRKDDDTSMRLGDVLVELQTIVASSDASAQRAKSVSSVEQRRSWWKERKELDMRMQELVEHVEQDWLGGFKVRRSASSSIVEMFKSAQTMLQPPLCASGSTLATFRLRCEAIFASLLNDKDAMRIRLNTHHLHALAATSATCDTDELEDWLLTTADALQLAGLPISHDELDLDHVRRSCFTHNASSMLSVAGGRRCSASRTRGGPTRQSDHRSRSRAASRPHHQPRAVASAMGIDTLSSRPQRQSASFTQLPARPPPKTFAPRRREQDGRHSRSRRRSGSYETALRAVN